MITGASSGLGEAISIELAKKGYNLKLIARSESKLMTLKKQLMQSYEIKVDVIVMDLLDETAVWSLITHHSKDVEVLVNNAGIGYLGTFDELSFDQHNQILQLNVKTLQMLTYYFLQQFKQQDKGYILNIASTAAFSSGPLMASYYASKAYVLSLGEAISEELKQIKSNVIVSTCCPGPINTSFHQRANIKATRSMPSAQQVAKQAVEHLFKKKSLVIIGGDNQLLIQLNRLMPRRLTRYLVYKNQVKKTR